MDFFKQPSQIGSGIGLGLATSLSIYLPRLADHYDEMIKQLTTHLKATVFEVQDLIDQKDETNSLKQEVKELRKEVNQLKLFVRSMVEEKRSQLIPMPIQVPSQDRRDLDFLLGTGSSSSTHSRPISEQKDIVHKSGDHSLYSREEVEDEEERKEERTEEDDEEEALRIEALASLKRK